MSRDFVRKNYYHRERERDRDWGRNDYRFEKRRSTSRKRSRSPPRESEKRRSRSPRKSEKELLDENILSEISKLPEPSELWDNQMQEGGYNGPPPPAFSQEGNNYGSNYQPSYSGIYDDFPPLASMSGAPIPPDISSWNQMSLPPPPAAPIYNVEDQIKKEAAIKTEMRHHKAALSKQREDYIKKTGILKKELDTLKDQRNELRGESKRSPSPDTKRFLKENTKLQLEIQNKLKTINNVVDMLNGIIGEEAQEIHDSDDSPERNSKRKSRSPSGKKFNYVYYDPEMHWCRVCNEFPPTAKEYLNHLHSAAHHKMAAAHMEAPWHSVSGVNEGFPSYSSAPTKRTPIRGLQFFVPSTAWYCKLCDQFIGDLHCASSHLKSITHSKNYTNFVEQNPHWETDWMSDRSKAFEKVRGGKAKEAPPCAALAPPPGEDGAGSRRKKSKRRRDSSSADSSSDSEPKKKKKSKKSKNKSQSDEKLSEWMSSIKVERLNENDRKLLDNIKTRISLDKQMSRRSPPREPRRERESERRDSRSREDRERLVDSRRREDRRDERREDKRDERREDRRDERRDDRREERDDRRDERRDDRREERDERREERDDDRVSTRRTPPRQESKKPDTRKMPFIGKMPVFKNLSKNTKGDEPKRDEQQKKKEEEEVTKKRREEMDAEIQKKVAEFKQKIAAAQLERQQAELPPPMLLPGLPLQHPFLPPPQPAQPPPPATSAPPPNLPKDFQDALDIIFPSEVKNAEMAQQELFGVGLGGGFPVGLGGVMQPFPPLSLLGQPPPHVMMGFDMFPPRPQLYDAHVPLVPQNKPRQNKPRPQPHKQDKKKGNSGKNAAANSTRADKAPTTSTSGTTQTSTSKPASSNSSKNKEELDDLAMLGIDADDVGAGM